jgi:tRNA pseudouridine38-40 synthase
VKRYFLQLFYNGAPYSGWQKQNNAPSVQQEVEKALSLKLQSPTEVVGCGRTDTGVHAHRYFAHFDTDKKIELKDLKYQLNAVLPESIGILEIFEVKQDAHARFDATSRSYRYFIHHQKNPFITQTSWYLYNTQLDLGKMNQSAEMLLNYKDFSAFEKVGSDNKTSICRVEFAEWFQNEEGIYFEIRADRFLRNMVRAIVGTLIDVGTGKIGQNEFRQIIESKNRSEAGASVPARGLFLWDVTYPLGIREL